MLEAGEEPVGVRVLTYQSSPSINTILNDLNEDEIWYLREFARYLLSQQLKVEKNMKLGFGSPENLLGFSLREFAIITGLPCGELPKNHRNIFNNRNLIQYPIFVTG
ncbi:hypothetical protein IGI04_007665 [Brassica rapa subsp. trilocularis]|uniref:DUF1985 domain-containing protein n=1 Tax=Brassica rapa subsp. trilocularis TaxID=1813537 RepID=A0ABQ7NKC9_BRACM|nr:hypothetical protein IGI04_007665 [Brassica rapa subsp. trilocularis]